ncbi:MAG: Rpn family recombination-promoting nuclease/putative transposase [Thermoguttaceae bacterium]
MNQHHFDRKQYQHDAFDKSVFRDTENARKIVEWMFRENRTFVEKLDLGKLEVCEDSYLDDELRESFVDVLYRIPLRSGEMLCVFILIELKTSSERFTMFQVLKYVVRIWDAEFKKFRLRQEQGEEQPATFLFPMVFPMIVHHGETRFTAPIEMADLQDVVDGFELQAVRLKAILFDLAQMSESDLPDDPELWASFTMMQAVFSPKIDEHLLNVYEKVYPLFEQRPSLLGRWKQMFWYAISSCKYFTREVCAKTIVKINKVRGANMSVLEKPVYLMDVLLAEGAAIGETRGKADALLRVVNARFKGVPKRVSDRISQIRDGVVLDSLTVTAATCQSLKELEEVLG